MKIDLKKLTYRLEAELTFEEMQNLESALSKFRHYHHLLTDGEKGSLSVLLNFLQGRGFRSYE